MAISDVLKGMRQDDYGKPEDKKESSGAEGRAVMLTDDELKGIGYEDGTEVECKVTGRLDGKTIHVTSVESLGGNGEMGPEDEAKVAGIGQQPPTMRPSTMPYPS